MWNMAKRRDFQLIAEYSQGTCRLVRGGGREMAEKVIREEADEFAANRVMKTYSPADELTFAQRLGDWHRAYGDPDAVRSALRALADMKHPVTGQLIRLSTKPSKGR
jgi:hypothetical protein